VKHFLKTYRPDFRANLRLAWPIIAGQVGQVTVHIADNIMVGRLGSIELAAISLGVAIYTVFLVLGLGISFALPPLVAEADGQQDRQHVASYFKHSLVANLVFAVFNIACVEACIPFLGILGQEPQVVELMIPYLRFCTYSMIPFMLFQTFRSLSDGLSKTIPAMVATLVGNALNIGLNYLLIFGKAGLPAMGVAGAGLSTFIARICMFIVIVLLLSKMPRVWQHIKPIMSIALHKDVFRKIFNLGVPTSLQMAFEILVFSGSTVMMGIIASEAQAAHQIALNLITVSFMFCYGLSVAATIRVGNALGAGDMPAVRRAGFSTIFQAGAFMIFSAILFILGRHFLPTIYINDPVVVDTASTLLVLAALFQLSDGVQVAAIGTLRGLQDVRYPTVVTFIAYILIGFSVAYVTAFPMGLGPSGIWIGLLTGLTISAVFNTCRFHRLTRG
jgi:MATE family multidrug resistance protein